MHINCEDWRLHDGRARANTSNTPSKSKANRSSDQSGIYDWVIWVKKLSSKDWLLSDSDHVSEEN